MSTLSLMSFDGLTVSQLKLSMSAARVQATGPMRYAVGAELRRAAARQYHIQPATFCPL
jgi:hypothetical protein